MLIDTNILLYAFDEYSPHHAACAAFLKSVQGSDTAWHLAWQNVYEFLRNATRSDYFKRPLTFPEALSFLDALTTHPRLTFLTETDRHRERLSEALKTIPNPRGVFFHDAHLAALCLEHGVRKIATTDIEFRKFPFLEIIDPTAPPAAAV